MANSNHSKHIISASEISNYVVCPEAWRLKFEGKGHKKDSDTLLESRRERKEWIENQDLLRTLKKHSKTLFLLLVSLVLVILILEQQGHYLPSPIIGSLFPSEIGMLLLVLAILIFIWDLFDRRSKKIAAESGLESKSEMVALRGSSEIPTRIFTSEQLGLSGYPDALIKEDNHIIPVSIKPSGKKVKDRHVVEIMTYLKLIEEAEAKKPPYGILLIGPEKRAVKINNAKEKQRWVDTLIDEMRSIIEGVPAQAKPEHYKCKNCDVNQVCEHSAYKV